MIRAKIDLLRLGLTCSGGQKALMILVFTSAALSSMKMALLGSLFDIFSWPYVQQNGIRLQDTSWIAQQHDQRQLLVLHKAKEFWRSCDGPNGWNTRAMIECEWCKMLEIEFQSLWAWHSSIIQRENGAIAAINASGTKGELHSKKRIAYGEEEEQQLYLQQAWHHLMGKNDRL